jgi:glutamyl-tRNA synthetase
MRERQRTAKENIGYNGTCRELTPEESAAKLSDGVPHVVRLATPSEGASSFEDALRGTVSIPNAQIDDQVLLKSDGFPTYHLATVVDDHAMGITHVIRAEEWISSTPKHVLLLDAFGWERPVFCHMPLLRNPDKNKTKISKRKNPVSLTWYRSEGFLPEALLNFLGLMGSSMPDEREVFSLQEFEAAFDPSRLKTTGPVFDLKKLEWLNGEWIRGLAAEDFISRLHTHFGDRYTGRDELTEKVVTLVQSRIKKLSEWPIHADAFYVGRPEFDRALLTPKKVNEETARKILSAGAECLAGVVPFTAEALDSACRALADELELKIRSVFMVLRVAISGAKVSPPLFESMEILGKDETLQRIRSAFA